MNPFLAIGLISIGCIIGAIGAVFLKLSSGKFSLSLALFTNWQLFVGLVMYGIASIIFIPMLKFLDLSIAYPFVATTHIWVCIFSRIFLKEKISLKKWLGIILIIAGVTFIGLGV